MWHGFNSDLFLQIPSSLIHSKKKNIQCKLKEISLMCDLYRFHSKANSRSECDEWMNLPWPYWGLYELTDTHWVTNIILTIYCLDQSPTGNHSSQRCRKWQPSCEHVPWGTSDSRGRCVNPFCSRWSACVKLQKEGKHWNDSCYLIKEWR